MKFQKYLKEKTIVTIETNNSVLQGVIAGETEDAVMVMEVALYGSFVKVKKENILNVYPVYTEKTVEVTCYGETKQMNINKAVLFYTDCAKNSEGSEQSRYLSILRGLNEECDNCNDNWEY